MTVYRIYIRPSGGANDQEMSFLSAFDTGKRLRFAQR